MFETTSSTMSNRGRPTSAPSALRRYGPFGLLAIVVFYFVFVLSNLFGNTGAASSAAVSEKEGDVVAPLQSNHELSPFHLLFGITTDNTMLKFDTLFGKAILIVNGNPTPI
jgi:hypothetical protein